MEALWKLEEKWNLSTQKAIAIFTCALFLLIGVCLAAAAAEERGGAVRFGGVVQAAGRAAPAGAGKEGGAEPLRLDGGGVAEADSDGREVYSPDPEPRREMRSPREMMQTPTILRDLL
ncbi:hypothetical protein AAHA92_30168 [Salvia divinorum]|uniref:Uncharacterized protein n=1 Tax=Salvia divinorum TaxID=28513 RepID=A0ABD1G1Q2_SALDI